jgi:acyl-CoA synthetase (AMP-forming)/AMP-acid ligase II
MLARASVRNASKTAVVERERASSYADLEARAGAVAHALVSAGVEPGDRVVVLLDRGADAVASYFGVLAAGGVVVMLNAALRPRQIEYALSHSGARAFVTSSAILVRMHRDIVTDAAVLDLDALPGAAPFEPVEVDDRDPAQITYTSGSSGMPKGVVASHANVWAAIRIVAGYLDLQESDQIAGLLPPSGVYGANQVLCSVFVGATLVVPTSPLMNQIAAELREAETTVLAAVPPLWLQLIQAPGFAAERIPSLRILQNAGGHLAPAAVRQLRALQPQARIFLQYGMTEVFRSSYLPPEEIDRLPGSMGRPMPETEILVVRDDGSVCDVDEVGELVHCGPTVTDGYWNDPERTSLVYRPHPVTGEGRVVHSGDMVRSDAEGFLHFVGRRDRMIKTLGYRVGPDEILDVLYASGEIEEGAVTALEDADRGQGVVAYVVLKSEGSVKALRNFCRAELPRYMQPTRFVELSELPKLPNGKHDFNALGALTVGT